MITLKVTITGKSANTEEAVNSALITAINEMREDFGQLAVQCERLETTVPLTLELAAQRVVDDTYNGCSKPEHLHDLRRVLAGDYVCVPVEPAP